MWIQRFIKVDKAVQSLTAWAGLFALVSAALTWVSKQVKVFGSIGWPEAVFMGLGATCVIVLSLAVGMGAWRFFRPLPRNGSPSLGPDSPQINSLVASVVSLRNDAAVASGEIVKLRDAVEALSGSLLLVGDTAGQANGTVRGLAVQVEQLAGRIEEEVQYSLKQNKLIASHDASIRSILSSVRTLAHRETLSDLAERVTKVGAHLVSAATEAHDPAYWRGWVANQSQWRGFVDDWIVLAQRYEPQVRYSVYNIPEVKYASKNWDFDEAIFPSYDDAHNFKSFAIIYNNFVEARARVDDIVYKAIFADSGAEIP